MTDITSAAVPAQAGPPLADTSDMAQVHRVFRDAVAAAPAFIGSATAAGPARVELVATYYDNVLRLLHAHHNGEDELLWPKLCERAPELAAEVRRVAQQHDGVTTTLEAAVARISAWRETPTADSAGVAAAAVAELAAALLPHLDEEEAFIVPLAAQHIFAPEWGELPMHAMQHLGGGELWLILGLVREQMRPDQIATMEAHMPPPLLTMWAEQGQAAFDAFAGQLRAGS